MTYKEYLTAHSLSEESVKNFGIKYDEKNNRIIIPVYDENGTVLYNKYRNLLADDNPEVPKYTFDKGTKAVIYNPKSLNSKWVIITEGEFDTIKLITEGFPAVTGTAGAKTFPEEWIPLFQDKEIYLAYDSDKAGKEAIQKLAQYFPNAYVIELPTKDICEYFAAGNTKTDFRQLLGEAKGEEITAFNYISKHKLITATDLVNKEFPNTEWLVKDLIPGEGFTAITGQPYTYKSFLTQYIALCVASGIKLFNHFEVTEGAVLIVDKENTQHLIKERLVRLGVAGDPPIYFIEEPENYHLTDDSTLQWTKDIIKKNKIRLIIFDSFVHIHKGDENDSGAVAETFEKLKNLGCAVVFIHHHRKETKFFTGTALEMIRGSSDIGAELDAHLALANFEGKIKVTQGKNRWGALLQSFTIAPIITENSAVFEYVGQVSEEASKAEKVESYIITTLMQSEKVDRQTLIELSEGTASKRTVLEIIKKLSDNGSLISGMQNRRKWYALSTSKRREESQREMQIALPEIELSQ